MIKFFKLCIINNMGKKYRKEDEVSMKEYLDAKMELEKAQKEAGIVEEEKGLSRFISWIFEKQSSRKKHTVKKMLYIWMAILGGWCGLHRFYEKRWILGIIYAIPVIASLFNKDLFGLVGLPMAMAVIDILIAVGHYSNESGEIII